MISLLGVIASGYRSAGSIVTTDLINYLDFGNTNCYPGTGTAINDLVDSLAYTANGPTFSTTQGGAFNFDGVNDYIVSNNTRTRAGDFSVGAWFYRSGTTGANMSLYNIEVSNNVGYRHLLDENGGSYYIRARINNTNTDYLTATTNQTWYYHMATFNQTTDDVTLYLNGSLVASGSFTGSFSVTNEYLMVGASSLGGSTGATQRMKGFISEIHAYDRELKPTEVTQNWNATKLRYGY